MGALDWRGVGVCVMRVLCDGDWEKGWGDGACWVGRGSGGLKLGRYNEILRDVFGLCKKRGGGWVGGRGGSFLRTRKIWEGRDLEKW